MAVIGTRIVAMLDAQRPFILADVCTIHEYSDADKLGL